MAASVRIEDRAFGDPRFAMLGTLCGVDPSLADSWALGTMAKVWRHCTQRQSYEIAPGILNALACRLDFAEAVVTAELGESGDHGIRIRGTAGRIEWLGDLHEKRVAAGRARASGGARVGGRFAGKSPISPAATGKIGDSIAAYEKANDIGNSPIPAVGNGEIGDLSYLIERGKTPATSTTSKPPAPAGGLDQQTTSTTPAPTSAPAPAPAPVQKLKKKQDHPDDPRVARVVVSLFRALKAFVQFANRVEGYRELVDLFDSEYQRAYGVKPTWGQSQGAHIKALLRAHGIEECLRRVRIYFHSAPTWITQSGRDVNSLRLHFDKLATPARRDCGGPSAAELAQEARDLADRGE